MLPSNSEQEPLSAPTVRLADLITMERLKKELRWLAAFVATALALAWMSSGFAWPEPTLVFYTPYSAFTDSPWSRSAVIFLVLVVARVLVGGNLKRTRPAADIRPTSRHPPDGHAGP